MPVTVKDAGIQIQRLDPEDETETEFHLQGQHNQTEHGNPPGAQEIVQPKPADQKPARAIKGIKPAKAIKPTKAIEPIKPIDKLGLQYVTEFYNKCHNPEGPAGGQFCESLIDSGNLNAKEKKAVQGAYSAIREVHELPKGFAKAYVEMTNSEVLGQNVDGSYNSGEDRILLNADKANNAITFVHEFGHHLSLSGEGNFTLNQFQDRIDRSNPLRSWRDAVQQSDTIQGLRESHERTDDPYYEYLLDDREIFARSYAQYIATRSGNKTLKAQFDELDVNMKWSDKEFEPIARALDRVFTYERMSRGDFKSELLQRFNNAYFLTQ